MKQIKRGHYKEDEFQNTMEKIAKYVVRHREKSIFIGVSVVVVVVLAIFFLSRGEQANPKADLMHTQALGMLTTGRIQDAQAVLQELTRQYPNTRSGKIGFYYLGTLAYYAGRFEESLEHFDRFLSAEKNDRLLTPSALMGAGGAAEGIKDYERALKYYEKVKRDEKSPLYAYGALSFGRVMGLLGRTEEARKALQELLDNEPPSDVAADARFYMGYFKK